MFGGAPPRMLNSVVYSIDTTVLNSHYRLASGEVSIHEYRNRPVARSLIDAAMDELLDQASDGLLRSDPGLSNGYREAEETIRAAGRRLVRNSAFRTNQHALDADYFFMTPATRYPLLSMNKPTVTDVSCWPRETQKV